MSSYISATLEEYRQLTTQWQEFVSQNDPIILNTEPDPKSWSAAECLKHVTVTGTLYAEHLAKVISKAKQGGSRVDAEYSPGVLGRYILSQTNPPYAMRIKTFPVIDPVMQNYNLEDLTDEYKAMKQSLQGLISNLEGINIKRKYTPSAITPLLWMPLGLWFRFIAAHERRHLWQARRAVERVNNNAAILKE